MNPLHTYLVKVENLNNNYHKRVSEYGFEYPEPVDDDTANMVDRGIVVGHPLTSPDPSSVGKMLIFNFLNAHHAKINLLPRIEGHLLVEPENVVCVGEAMRGQYVSCTPIPLWDGKGIRTFAYKQISYDSLKTPELQANEYYTTCGIVDKENEHFPVGTKVWWGMEGVADPKWESGWLVKARNILLWGDKVDQFIFKRK